MGELTVESADAMGAAAAAARSSARRRAKRRADAIFAAMAEADAASEIRSTPSSLAEITTEELVPGMKRTLCKLQGSIWCTMDSMMRCMLITYDILTNKPDASTSAHGTKSIRGPKKAS